MRFTFRFPDAGAPALRPSRAGPDVQLVVEGDGLAAAAANAAASLFAVNTTHLSDSTDRVPVVPAVVVRATDGSAARAVGMTRNWPVDVVRGFTVLICRDCPSPM